jgi:hypothetical protein
MDEQTVGVLLGGQPNGGFTHVHGGRQPGDFSRVLDLQAIQCFRRIGHLSGDAQEFVEI